ncbi:D-amino-acid transaminase [Candidatus Phycosocius spiralis]|uniref:Probable branched-chain-amino-acid aminotransferase n=1 Tax=Candidatus Phycosocius spiralis TaxID=2815099 RepID=A0ABQ4PSI0_9PROT|nr:D-amino-acid transaminase [Candidatus Phycosocius spiralis]GIU65968.1 D-alanine aminotransferase [Candidatus Phycosocius spiralis]
MPRIAYVDGQFVQHSQACIHVEDRGLQFGDAVYEVWAVRDGYVFDRDGHLARLGRSLAALSIKPPLHYSSLMVVIRELIARNKLKNGLIYLQISRGVARRDHPFPPHTNPSIILTARSLNQAKADERAQKGIRITTCPDNRWGRVDIKTVNLLANVLAKQTALDAGFDDAWFVDDQGMITEGTAQNAWILDQVGRLRTTKASPAILRGVTRDKIIEIASRLGYPFEERAFSVPEALKAQEAFMTSATSFVTPIIAINGCIIGDGKPGKIALSLRTAYISQQTSVKINSKH